MVNDLDELTRVAMRTAIRKHPKAKLWAKVNCEDNFMLAVHSTALDAAMDEVIKVIDEPRAIDWLNKNCNNDAKLRAFVMETCREMYGKLRHD
jgi:hypothetical protein